MSAARGIIWHTSLVDALKGGGHTLGVGYTDSAEAHEAEVLRETERQAAIWTLVVCAKQIASIRAFAFGRARLRTVGGGSFAFFWGGWGNSVGGRVCMCARARLRACAYVCGGEGKACGRGARVVEAEEA